MTSCYKWACTIDTKPLIGTNGVSIKMSITKDVYCNGQHRDDSKRTTPDDSKRTDGYGRYLIMTCAKKVVQSCQRVHLEQNDSENHLPHSKKSQLLKKPPKQQKTIKKLLKFKDVATFIKLIVSLNELSPVPIKYLFLW